MVTRTTRGKALAEVLAAAVLAVAGVAAVWLVGSVGYGLSAEYGFLASSWQFLVVGAAVVGLMAGTLFLAADRLIRRRERASILVAATILVSVAVLVTAAAVGDARHRADEDARSLACTPARVAVLTELNLPYTAGSPAGQADGTCSDDFLVPGTLEQVDALLTRRLDELGWTRLDRPGVGETVQRYRRADRQLAVEVIAVDTEVRYVTVRVTVR